MPKLHLINFLKYFKLFVPKVPLETFCSLWIDDCQNCHCWRFLNSLQQFAANTATWPLVSLFNCCLPKLPQHIFLNLQNSSLPKLPLDNFHIFSNADCQNCHLTFSELFTTVHCQPKTATCLFVSFQLFIAQTVTIHLSGNFGTPPFPGENRP